MSRFSKVSLGKPFEIPTLYTVYREDLQHAKANLATTEYRNEKGIPLALNLTKNLDLWMAYDDALHFDYLPIFGLKSYSDQAATFLLGINNKQVTNGLGFSVQCISKCGTMRVGAELLAKTYNYKTFYYSNPSPENYSHIFKSAGFRTERVYRYCNPKTKCIDLEGMLEDLKQAPKHSVIILQLCSHNPSGCDPTKEQWKEICKVINEKGLFPFFDATYHGFATGDFDQDAWPIRYFALKNIEFFCVQSFSKIMGLYNDRIGNLIVIMNSIEVINEMKSKLTFTIRGLYSTPPNHGARIVTSILTNSDLCLSWKDNIMLAVHRLKDIRQKLRLHLEILNTPGTWDHITSQRGLFSFTGLTEKQIEHLIFHYHIYLNRSGGINISGVNDDNVEFISSAICKSILTYPQN